LRDAERRDQDGLRAELQCSKTMNRVGKVTLGPASRLALSLSNQIVI
jgi:hypothetical protein